MRKRVRGTREEYAPILRGTGKTMGDIYQKEVGRRWYRRAVKNPVYGINEANAAIPSRLWSNIGWQDCEAGVDQPDRNGLEIAHTLTRIRITVEWPAYNQSNEYADAGHDGPLFPPEKWKAPVFVMVVTGPGGAKEVPSTTSDEIFQVVSPDDATPKMSATYPVVDTQDGRWEVVGFERLESPNNGQVERWREGENPIGYSWIWQQWEVTQEIAIIDYEATFKLKFRDTTGARALNKTLWIYWGYEDLGVNYQAPTVIDAALETFFTDV